MEATKVKEMVRRRYGQFAKAGSGCGCSCGCSTAAAPAADVIGARIGYTAEDMAAVPDGANLGLGCGNPVGLASIREGDTVLDADPNLHGTARLLRWLPKRLIERTAKSVVSLKIVARKPA